MSQALTKLEASIEAQQKKLAQLKAQKQRIEARQRAKEQGLARKQDTRKKILAGALLLELMEKDPELRKQILGKLSTFLSRPDDRALFGLPSGHASE
ncbi:mobilization protein [Piscinibacter koreensis]|uniref:Mobilization protein n=1 Tax=Piscinibacter koreensis TaxID=2742824 RepID=A0A7Y6TZE8_9BURK|nr:mobilization protein [Schlegelella koreensis]NUZ09065.1 mobilization protein [Schlegelella koreensis]